MEKCCKVEKKGKGKGKAKSCTYEIIGNGVQTMQYGNDCDWFARKYKVSIARDA